LTNFFISTIMTFQRAKCSCDAARICAEMSRRRRDSETRGAGRCNVLPDARQWQLCRVKNAKGIDYIATRAQAYIKLASRLQVGLFKKRRMTCRNGRNLLLHPRQTAVGLILKAIFPFDGHYEKNQNRADTVV
jgi:hypothetical protein